MRTHLSAVGTSAVTHLVALYSLPPSPTPAAGGGGEGSDAGGEKEAQQQDQQKQEDAEETGAEGAESRQQISVVAFGGDLDTAATGECRISDRIYSQFIKKFIV